VSMSVRGEVPLRIVSVIPWELVRVVGEERVDAELVQDSAHFSLTSLNPGLAVSDAGRCRE
jgi:hypothetical protein